MKSSTTDDFWKCYDALPDTIKDQAKEAFRTFSIDHYHPGLNFKRIRTNRSIFSVRITRKYRAVGIQQGNDIIWFWIGSHSGYEKIMKQLRD